MIMRYLIIAVFLLMSACQAEAGTTLSLDAAEMLLLENNIEIKSRNIEMQKSDASIIEAKVLPNPAVRYSIESLQNGERETEQTYSVLQNVDITGKRSKRIDAALKGKEASSLLLAHEIAGLLVQMKQSFYRILLLTENERTLSDIAGIIADIEGKTATRVSAGDASEADLMKLRVEKNKIIRGIEALRADLKSEKSKLALLLNVESISFDVSGEFAYSPLSPGIEAVKDSDQLTRPDLLGQQKRVEALEFELSASKKTAIPSIDLEAGYKTRTGGFNGFIFGVSVPLPLFDRNQGGIARAEAELAQEKLLFEAMKKTAAYEVNVLLERIASLQTRIADLSQQVEAAKELTKIAGIAYEEGESGLLDLLDAARSEKELVVENNSAIYEYWSAHFELERAIGAGVKVTGETK